MCFVPRRHPASTPSQLRVTETCAAVSVAVTSSSATSRAKARRRVIHRRDSAVSNFPHVVGCLLDVFIVQIFDTHNSSSLCVLQRIRIMTALLCKRSGVPSFGHVRSCMLSASSAECILEAHSDSDPPLAILSQEDVLLSLLPISPVASVVVQAPCAPVVPTKRDHTGPSPTAA